ncbi:hypothetical protein [Streptomyces sp. NPDC007205]|uniref:hypothetical protein n=1 Tax=Streptomyces sp. NPDC007205 TaxID=3154316 RepID=UPI0033DC3E13
MTVRQDPAAGPRAERPGGHRALDALHAAGFGHPAGRTDWRERLHRHRRRLSFAVCGFYAPSTRHPGVLADMVGMQAWKK